MDINRPGVLDAIFWNLRKDFMDGIQAAKPIAAPLYKVVPSTGAENVYAWLQHLPGFREMYRNQQRVIRNVQSQSYRVPNRKFEDTIEIPIDDINDDQIGQYSLVAGQLGATMALIPDTLTFEVFNLGFTTMLAYDGLPLFSASHKVGISTVNNLTNLTLTADHLKSAIQTMLAYSYKMDKISPVLPLNPLANKLVLLVPPALKSTAEELVLMRRNAAGADNVLFGQAEVMVAPYLAAAFGGSDTAWYLVNAGGTMSPLIVQEREKVTIMQKTPANDSVAFAFDAFVIGAKARYAALPTYPWLFYGSTGLAAS